MSGSKKHQEYTSPCHNPNCSRHTVPAQQQENRARPVCRTSPVAHTLPSWSPPNPTRDSVSHPLLGNIGGQQLALNGVIGQYMSELIALLDNVGLIHAVLGMPSHVQENMQLSDLTPRTPLGHRGRSATALNGSESDDETVSIPGQSIILHPGPDQRLFNVLLNNLNGNQGVSRDRVTISQYREHVLSLTWCYTLSTHGHSIHEMTMHTIRNLGQAYFPFVDTQELIDAFYDDVRSWIIFWLRYWIEHGIVPSRYSGGPSDSSTGGGAGGTGNNMITA